MTELTTPYGPVGPREGQPATDYRTDPILSARPRWRRELYRVIFEHDTPSGKLFDIALIVAILVSVAAVMLESVGSARDSFGSGLRIRPSVSGTSSHRPRPERSSHHS